ETPRRNVRTVGWTGLFSDASLSKKPALVRRWSLCGESNSFLDRKTLLRQMSSTKPRSKNKQKVVVVSRHSMLISYAVFCLKNKQQFSFTSKRFPPARHTAKPDTTVLIDKLPSKLSTWYDRLVPPI